ncbi:MAG TPA: hypothetical protein PLA71_00910 [Saccharofermentans sp.]|nr:hypothetical protein [Saccharofermentans sp.]
MSDRAEKFVGSVRQKNGVDAKENLKQLVAEKLTARIMKAKAEAFKTK